jgi:hypothetical protein
MRGTRHGANRKSMIESITSNRFIKRAVYIVMGLLALAMVVLSLVQLWVLNTVDYVPAYGSVQANELGWPQSDQRGLFIILNGMHNQAYQGNLLQLLPTTAPGVIDKKAGAHLLSREINYLLVQSAALSEPGEYQVYRIADPEVDKMRYARQPGGKVLLITPESGTWKPGAYEVSIPAEGMFGGRTYFQFFVDPESEEVGSQ